MKIMTINVNITGMQRVSTSEKTVTQVLFDGTAEGEYFNGTILPGGVDTQINVPEKGTLSARYMLEGKDNSGDNCKMYIYFEKISICTPFSTIVNSPRSSASFSQRRFSLSVKMCGVVMLQIEIFSK